MNRKPKLGQPIHAIKWASGQPVVHYRKSPVKMSQPLCISNWLNHFQITDKKSAVTCKSCLRRLEGKR